MPVLDCDMLPVVGDGPRRQDRRWLTGPTPDQQCRRAAEVLDGLLTRSEPADGTADAPAALRGAVSSDLVEVRRLLELHRARRW